MKPSSKEGNCRRWEFESGIIAKGKRVVYSLALVYQMHQISLEQAIRFIFASIYV